MGWIADLLKEIPSAARYKAELEEIEKENIALKKENEDLKSQIKRRDEALEKETSRADKIDPVAEEILKYLMQHDQAPPSQIAGHLQKSKPLTEMHLHSLTETQKVGVFYGLGGETSYYLDQEGRLYLHSHGLL